MPRPFLAAALLALPLPLAAQTDLPPAVTAAEANVSADSIRAYDKYLSDDLLEGRYPGQRGGELAAKYIASQFESYGLKPGGDHGTYFQQVDFTSVKADPIKTTFTLVPKSGAPIKLKFADDFVVFNSQLTPSATINAPIVWMGYGITAPEFQWDDYAGIDVKGKVILCIVNDPPSDDPNFFGGKSLTYYGRWTYKFEQAARKGAVGALIIHRTDLAAYGWDVVRNSNSAEKTFLAHDANPRLEAASWIQLDVAKQIFAASGTDLDTEFAAAGKHGFKARELPVKLDATVISTVRNFQSPNVIGILPGTSPAPDQAVIYTGHYDHLGVKADAKPGEDAIFNGAGDNGTGTAMIMEMARAVTSAKLSPPHSMIFAAVTAEEQGLLGSAYLSQHPPLPIGQINLDLNFDEILPFGQGDQLHASGSQRTSFYPTLEATAKRFGYSVPAPRPDTGGGYYRSDHFSFAHAGVPAFSVGQGGTYKGHDAAWSQAQGAAYNKNDYHNVSDNFKPEWDFVGNATLCRLGIELGWKSVTSPPIEWKAGDEFAAARKASK
ncbi:M28 family peptidase [Granulicella tundricola]|uniref:Peptidase M28 n=1 Tax=Granulicella tundricola (strain ATCC BAA-1859 / DSM 23138 / MP5ACTX9) TaxID=1198114 RepID=E8X1M0_GRATM|nr:M28 family peptidase [Granulicella tundricola]ADW70255.1 peptidase M28 [Granulicella tundricola MP5ACTX9]